MKELVNHILYVAKSNNKKITHLQLQKITYFIFGYLIREGHELITEQLYADEQFQAWLYGPVIPSIYEEFKKYKSMPILHEGQRFNDIDSLSTVNEVILNLINHDVFDLVNVSHKHQFWKDNETLILNNKKPTYPYDVLRGEFTR